MLGGTPGTGPRVDSSQVFDSDSLARVRQGDPITAIRCRGQRQVVRTLDTSQASRNFLVRTFRRLVSLARGEANIGKGLFSVYVRRFKNLTAKTVAHADQMSPQVSPATREKTARPADLKTPDGFHVAAAMELSGVLKMNHGRFGGIKIKSTCKKLNEVDLRRVDYFVNLNPHRLAFEFLALNKSVPNGFLERVLIPHYCGRLQQEAGFSELDAMSTVKSLLNLKELKSDSCVDLEPLMEMRNSIDQLVAGRTRDICSVKPLSPQIPKGSKLPSGSHGAVKKVTTSMVLEHGQVSRQTVRDYFIDELRKLGIPREKAREQVVMVLSQRGCEARASRISVVQFLNITRALRLEREHDQAEMIKVYLKLVDHLNETVEAISSSQCCRIMKKAGLSPDETYVVKEGDKQSMQVISRPTLEPPKVESGYTCNEDELWLIQARVDRRYIVRFTKDIIARIGRYAARSKRKMAVDIAARLSAALTLGLMSGGIGGALYLVTSTISLSCLVVGDVIWGHVQYWWHGRRLQKHDSSENASGEVSDRVMASMGHMAGESALVDIFNAYANLEKDLKGLEELKHTSKLSAADQIKFRKCQIVQQLRSSQLGESFKDLDRFIVESMTMLSDLESQFEDGFEDLWKAFSIPKLDEENEEQDHVTTKEHDDESGYESLDESLFAKSTGGQKRALIHPGSSSVMTEGRRLEIFRNATQNLKSLPLKARGDSQNWLRQLVHNAKTTKLKKSGKDEKAWLNDSDKVLYEAFSDLKPLPPKELRISALMAKLNWVSCNSLEAAVHSVKVIGHLLWTNITFNAGRFVRAGFRWLIQDVLPRKIDLTPIPTVVACVYWIVTFVGMRSSETVNNMLNRIRTRKVVVSRKNELGEDLAFDAEVTKLTAADWRAMRSESQEGIREFVTTLKALRKEHAQLAQEVKKIRQEKAEADKQQFELRALSEEELVHRASLILRRKHLEQKLQEILSGSVGHFFQEAIRGELAHRQLLEDIENDIVPVH